MKSDQLYNDDENKQWLINVADNGDLEGHTSQRWTSSLLTAHIACHGFRLSVQ